MFLPVSKNIFFALVRSDLSRDTENITRHRTTWWKKSKITEFIPELSYLAQFHPSTMKVSNSVFKLSKLTQFRLFDDVAHNVDLHRHRLISLGFSTPIEMIILPILILNRPQHLGHVWMNASKLFHKKTNACMKY